MPAEFSKDDDLRGATFSHVDLTGAEFREVDLTGARIIGAVMIDAVIDGLVENLVVNDVDVVPLVEAELDRCHPERLLLRSQDPDELRRGWSVLEEQWAATVGRIRDLPEERRQRRVDGEWSAVETLRHLINVTDIWFRREVLGEPSPYHPFGLPADFVTDWESMGIERGAAPPFDAVLGVRVERQALVRSFLATATEDELGRPGASDDAGWPPRRHTVAECLHVLMDEEWAHHRFCVRDLDKLEGRHAGDSVG